MHDVVSEERIVAVVLVIGIERAAQVVERVGGASTITQSKEALVDNLRNIAPVLHSLADAGPALQAELLTFCRQHLSSVKCPKSIDFDAELPRHPTGKLYKRLLKDEYWSAAGRNI